MGCSEIGCIGRAGGETAGLTAAREEPDLDALGLPFCDIVTAVVGVEASTKRLGAGIGDTTARATRRTVEGAVGESLTTGLPQTAGLALSVGVQRVGVGRVLIHPFKDVDLAPSFISDLTDSARSLKTYLTGQGSRPSDQKEGHVPHIPPGMCLTSRTKRPLLYSTLPSRRTLSRPTSPPLALFNLVL